MNRAPPASNQLTAPVTLSLPCYAGLAAYKATGNQDAVSARDDLAGNMTTAQINQAQAQAQAAIASTKWDTIRAGKNNSLHETSLSLNRK